MTQYTCCTDNRRNAVRLHATLNGIDFLEVSDKKSDLLDAHLFSIYLHLIKPVQQDAIKKEKIVVIGGERILNIQVVDVIFDVAAPNLLEIKVSDIGDFSIYTLVLTRDIQSMKEPDGFDPVLSSIDFRFRVVCADDFDCKQEQECPAGTTPPPEINYLAKDYAGFRQLMLDRMAFLIPEWKERNPADMGIMLVELLAYTADYLSYQQDAIATEAYLGTARKRVTVRRHARLVDYFMHDGCNARAWLQVCVGPGVDGVEFKKDGGAEGITRIFTKAEGLPSAFRIDSPEYAKAMKMQDIIVFQLMHSVHLYASHNEIAFYTWGKEHCCLPKNATRASLKGYFPNLKRGDVLILAELRDPSTGNHNDADPARRHPVKLTGVKISNDPLVLPPDNSPLWVSPTGPGLAVTEIEWHQEDALPFPLCISDSRSEDFSAAWGNIVLADHGLTVTDTQTSSLFPNTVATDNLEYAQLPDAGCDFCHPSLPKKVKIRYRPQLLHYPLTFATPYDAKAVSAASLMHWSVEDARPEIILQERGIIGDQRNNPKWEPQFDLLNSAANAREFVVETESDGISYLRFGNDMQGESPEPGVQFMAAYRVGNGKSGNIGADTLAHLATDSPSVLGIVDKYFRVWNPLPATGGSLPETTEEVKQFAPQAFRTQKRAVTPGDYEIFAKKTNRDVQRAAATMRWTGSWKTVFLTVDRFGGAKVDAAFEGRVKSDLEPYRMAGFDLEVDDPVFISLEIAITVCVNQAFLASHVKKELRQLLSSTIRPDGRNGFFHPDNFTFGQPLYLSTVYAAIQEIRGVDTVSITKFCRQGDTASDALDAGILRAGRREIIRCDNDPNFPERGLLILDMKGR